MSRRPGAARSWPTRRRWSPSATSTCSPSSDSRPTSRTTASGWCASRRSSRRGPRWTWWARCCRSSTPSTWRGPTSAARRQATCPRRGAPSTRPAASSSTSCRRRGSSGWTRPGSSSTRWSTTRWRTHRRRPAGEEAADDGGDDVPAAGRRHGRRGAACRLPLARPGAAPGHGARAGLSGGAPAGVVREGLLPGARGLLDRHGQGDHQGLPPAGQEVPSRCQPRFGGPLQGDLRGLRRPG